MKLRIMTFNIRGYKNYITNKIDFDSINNIIKKYNPDIVGFNEVFGNIIGNKCQIDNICKELKYFSFFGKSTRIMLKKYGNAIISRYRIIYSDIIDIPKVEKKKGKKLYQNRTILNSFIDADGTNINVFITHLGLNNDEQKKGIEELMKKVLVSKCIIMGDFNMHPKNKLLNGLRDKYIDLDEYLSEERYSFPSTNPKKKLDYIFISKDFTVKSSMIGQDIASDHLPYIVDIEI